MRAIDKWKAQKVLDKILTGKFDVNDVDNLFMGLREYSFEHPIFREIGNFFAHKRGRDKGITHKFLEATYCIGRYYMEYEIPKKNLDISTPFPSYVKRLMEFQVDKCKPGELQQKFNISPKNLKNRINDLFLEDKKTKTAVLAKPIDSNTFSAIRHLLKFWAIYPLFTADALMKNLIAVLHRNQLIFKKEAIMAQREHIVLCVMLLMHLSQFDFKDQPSCRCYISSLPPSDQSNEIVGNDVHVNFPRNTLLVTSLIEFPENTGPVTFWQHIFTSDLSVSNYCPESVLAGGKWGEYAGLYLFDQNLCLVENWKLGLLNA